MWQAKGAACYLGCTGREIPYVNLRANAAWSHNPVRPRLGEDGAYSGILGTAADSASTSQSPDSWEQQERVDGGAAGRGWEYVPDYAGSDFEVTYGQAIKVYSAAVLATFQARQQTCAGSLEGMATGKSTKQ